MSAWNHVLWTDWLINIKHGFKIRRELSDFGIIDDYEIVSGATVYRTIGDVRGDYDTYVSKLL